MTGKEREIVQALVDASWLVISGRNGPFVLQEAARLAHALLAEAEPVWAEGDMHVSPRGDGSWFVASAYYDGSDTAGADVRVRIPVPQRLLTPEVVTGEVVEGE